MIAARQLGQTAAALYLSLLMSCSEPKAEITGPPPWLTVPARYPWGDAVATSENRLARHVTAALGPRFGAADEVHAVAGSRAEIDRLERWYRDRVGPDWIRLHVPLSAGESAFGYQRGNQAVVIGWLEAQTDGSVPVIVFRFPAER